MLTVTTDLPGGNACAIRHETAEGLPLLRFTADPHGGIEALWFCLRIGNPEGLAGDCLVQLDHLPTLLGCGDGSRLRPVLRRDDGDWERLPPGTPVEDADGNRHARWRLVLPQRHLDLAFCYPYGHDDLAALLGDLGAGWSCRSIGVSQKGRELPRLANRPGVPGQRRPGIYCLARQHAAETPGSWVLDGFLRAVAAAGETAPLTWAVPFVNLDGVVEGDYGKDPFPWDLNRAWGRPPMRHEALVIQQDWARFAARCRPALLLDFHAPGGLESDGSYFYIAKPTASPEHHRRGKEWAAALAAGLGDLASADACRVGNHPSRWEGHDHMAKDQGWASWGMVGLTLETSYQESRAGVLTREAYREIGRRLAEVALQCLGAG